MEQSETKQWEKDQKVELYDLSQDKWISGKITNILQNNGKKTYCVAYHEYLKEVCEGDAHSLIRTPTPNQQSNDVSVKEAFLNYCKQIASKLPILRQIRVLSQNAERLKAQRMSFLYLLGDDTGRASMILFCISSTNL